MPWLLLLLGGLAFVFFRAFQRPRGVYLKSALGVLGAVLGWALFWLVMSPGNEAGFGFFVIWAVLGGLALALGLAACLGATARHVANSLRRVQA
jgi:uncharacterized membrane protein YeaQ/YmgE (transglycosylase-associated protein family)